MRRELFDLLFAEFFFFEPFGDLRFPQFVELGDVSDADLVQEHIPLVHLFDEPVENERGFFVVGNNGRPEMRDIFE